MEITNSMKEISNKSFDYEVNAGMRFKGKVDLWFWIAIEYYGAAEPPVRCGVSHLSGLTEPPVYSYSA